MLKGIAKSISRNPAILLAPWALARSPSTSAAISFQYRSFFRPTTASRLQKTTTMKPTVIVLALISLAGLAIIFVRLVPARASSAFSNSGVKPVRAGTCVDRYNSLLNNAKSGLLQVIVLRLSIFLSKPNI
jgi:hypothetical protein